jgi:alkanesulfonate monooxygenase SsuD/methylene tetrahydromethanopterin reductase-like flavin-dependent oxidoreductase (luciferase family)
MRFHMTQLTTYFPELDPPPEVYVQQLLEQIALAEELGWECFWFTEHHFIPYGGLVPNPAVMLAAAAARTSRIHLGSAISILPLRHPLQTAEDYAMVDVVSGGRLEFGIGRGNTADDYLAYGVAPAESRARFEEAAEVILRAWTSPRFSHAGTFWRFEDVTLYPRPVQRPHPPIWVAATSRDTAAWAGRRGYHIMTVAHPFPPEQVRSAVAAWRAALREAGYDPATRHNKIHIRVWVDENAERARAMAEAAIARYEAVARARRRLEGPLPAAEAYDWDGMLAAGRNIYGTPEQCIAGIHRAVRNYDFDILGTQFNYGGLPHEAVVRAMRLFAREVMPAFQ